jgi:hypothetical protein
MEIPLEPSAEAYRTARSRQSSAGIVRNLSGRNGIEKGQTVDFGYNSPRKLAAILGLSGTMVIKW